MQQPKILVAIRKRPLSKKQQAKGDTDIISIKNTQTLIVSEYKQKVDLTKYLEETIFNFDFAFDQQTTNQQIYQSAVRPLVESAFEGAKVTCFAYGQTGSGKTYTMNGQINQGMPGLYALGAQDIFSYLENPQFSHLTVKLSFFEIYCGKLFDLLNKRQQLKIREDNKSNINIIGMEQATITTWRQFIELLNYGSAQRVTSQNSANADSSRSHAILQITLKEGKKTYGKISFIDLAGNERGADHMDMNKQTRIDGAEINKSLLSLKECIRALDQGKGHTPFRGSKLTMVLKDSFVGFCRTLMIGNISPSSASSENSLNTLRYADRVKQLRKPQDVTSKEDIKAKQLMLPRQNKNAIKIDISKDDDQDDINKKRMDAQKQYGINSKKEDNISDKCQSNFTKRENYNQKPTSNHPKPTMSYINKPPLFSNQPPNKNPIPSTNFTKIPNNKKVPLFSPNDKLQVPLYLNNVYSQENTAPTTLHHLSRVNSYQLPNDKLYEFSSNMLNGKLSNNSSELALSHKNYNNFNLVQSCQQSVNHHLFRNKILSSSQNQQFQIPSSWEESIQMVQNTTNPRILMCLQQSISENLLIEETGLMEKHSTTLRNQIDIIKKQMSLISQLEVNKSVLSAREYVSFLEENIQQKLSSLQLLRQHLDQFTYKLDQLEEIQEKVIKAGGTHWEDQQLLDDLS